MSLPSLPETLSNLPKLREFLASLLQALQSLVDNAVLRDGSVSFTGDLSMGGHRITDLGDPIGGADAANKDYVDAAIGSGGGGGGGGGSSEITIRGKDFVSHQSGDFAIPSGSSPGVISGTNYVLNLSTSGNVTFTLSAIFIGSGTTPSAQFGLRIDGTDYICSKITETNISGTFATSDTPMDGVVAVNLVAGIHTIDWIGCSTNGTPKIKASGNVYATMDVDFPMLSGGGSGVGPATDILAVVNRASGSLSSSSGTPTALPSSNFTFTLTQSSTVAIDVFLFSEAGFTNFDNSGTFTFALQNTDTLVSTDMWMNTTGVQANGTPSANIQAGFGGIKRAIMTLAAGTYNFQLTGRVSGGLSFTVTYPLSIVVTQLG